MRRRELIVILGGAGLFAAPLVADAQQTGPVRRIGVLAQDLEPGLLDAFRAGLHDLGYDEGKNIAIDVRNAEGRNDRLPALIADLLSLKADVILAVNTPAALAAKKATSTVPIVILRVADPIKSGLVLSFTHPGGNVTGMYFMLDEFGSKGLEFLHEIVPTISRVGILYQGDNPGLTSVVEAAEQRGAGLGLTFSRLPVTQSSELVAAFAKAARDRVEALFVIDDGAMTKRRQEVLDLAAAHSLPVVSIYKDFVKAGGLIAYGPNLDVFYRHAAYYVDKILKGAAPGDLPVEQPAKLDLLINLKTAKALGLTIPQVILMRADEVIE
jgi:putative tryptophan/tyrosine transport system substrate-binding protein